MPSSSAVADSQANTDSNGSKPGFAWSRFHARINEVADNHFYGLGHWVATHPKRTLLISLVLVIACGFGFANFRVEADGEDLWVPQSSLAKDHESIVVESFANDGEYAAFLVESKSGNTLTKESVDGVWDLHAIAMAVEIDGKVFADVCAKELDGVTCEPPFRGVTRFWDDFAEYQASVTSDADIVAAVNVASYPDGTPVNHLALFGNGIVYDDDGSISAAKAIMQGYALVSDPEDGADINNDVFEWNAEFQDAMEEAQDDYTDVFDMFYLTSRSIDDALEESVAGEIFLFVTTYIIMVVFLMVAIGRCCAGSVEQRTWLGVAGVVVVVASALAAYGLNSGFAVPFTSLSQILPFILIGIGVDDTLVIVAAYDHTDASLPVEERVALALKRCGVSITYTSLTNFFAFMLGSLTSLPAVEYFCLYAATAILFDYLLQITAFVALLTMDANRQKAGKVDWLCCFTSKKYLQEQRQEEGIQRGVTLTSTPGNKPKHDLDAEVHQLSATGRFLKEKFTPALLSNKGKAFVLLGSAGLFVAGIYGVTQATQGFDVLDLAPDGHYAIGFTETAREYDFEISEWYVPMGVYTQEVDYPDVAVQAEMQSTDEKMLGTEFVSGPLTSWLTSFVEWADNSTSYSANVGTSGGYAVYEDRDTFYTALADFVEDGTNERFLEDIAFNDDGTIKISKSGMYLVDLTDTTNNVDALEDSRDVVDQSTLDPAPFAFSGVFVFSEQYLVIYSELLSSFGLALAAIFALSLFVIPKITVVLLVCVTVVIIDVELLGFVYHWGLDVNSITVIELIMAVGLVVDYMIHVVHYVLLQDPSIPKDTRIADALGEIGPSVIMGATTTLLGVMPLGFANNVIFRVFFKMFLVIISFGVFHGMVFIPVMLSILPDRLVSKLPQKDAGATVAIAKVDGKVAIVLEEPSA